VNASPPSLSPRCWAEIDLGALERNLRAIRAHLPAGIRYVAVVKADAYGHGLTAVVSRLLQAGVDALAVADVREGTRIRELAGGWPVLVLGPVLPGEEGRLLAADLTPTVSSAAEVARFARAADRERRRLPVHLNVDTGMGRLGAWYEEAGAVLEALLGEPALRLAGVYTHYSDAAHSPAFTRLQRDRFLAFLHDQRERLRPGGDLLVHADNSAGTEAFVPDSPVNAVRVGLLQYGIRQYGDSVFERVRVAPVFRFAARVGLVKELPAGVPVSYGRTFTTSRPTRTAVLTVGYGDGLPTTASNRAEVLLRGKRCPVIGRVTMDQTIVDATAVPEVQPGDTAVLVGDQDGRTISVEEFAEWCGAIPWEVFTSLSARVQRVYPAARA